MHLSTAAFLASSLVGLAALPAQAQTLTTVRVASGLDAPVQYVHPPGDPRGFIVEQPTGMIRILEDGQLRGTPFLDIGDKIRAGGERGLLGLAFHPDYARNGFFFVNYTNNSSDTTIERYRVSGDPYVADPSSGQVILEVDQPFSNHNGGGLAFGPDGYLWIGTGDGGSAGDPGNRAQNIENLLGKMLRIDVDGESPYAIPPDNPFVGIPGADEIWSVGLRNPWRFAFDRSTGDLWIGDVGQNLWEEIDMEPAGAPGGLNYGWRRMEGAHCFNPPVGCNPLGDLVLPVHEYRHQFRPPVRCSVTGGCVYRGSAVPSFQGEYVFGDYCSGEVWTFRLKDGEQVDFRDRTDELAPGVGKIIDDLVDFGQDAEGEVYIVDLGGEIYKIIPRIQLEVGELVGGQRVILTGRGATPGQRVYFVYSQAGPGTTDVESLDVALELASPTLITSAVADGDGVASISVRVPAGASGREVWAQAAELRNKSNVVNDTVQ